MHRAQKTQKRIHRNSAKRISTLRKPRKLTKPALKTPHPLHTFSSTPDVITFTVVGPKNYSRQIRTPPGRGLQKVLSAAKIAMLPSVCNGQLQCSSCHLKLEPELYFSLPMPDLPEQDILDIAADYEQDCSRLACQLKITADFDGQTLHIPDHFINHMDDPTETPVSSANLADHV